MVERLPSPVQNSDFMIDIQFSIYINKVYAL